MTLWISLPYATYGIEIENGRVTKAAPIARWMVGETEAEVARWLMKKGAVVACLRWGRCVKWTSVVYYE